jgi:hypothetical protein
MKITQHRKKWVMTKVEKYAKQLGIVNKNDMPTVVFTTRELEGLSEQRERLGGAEERLMGVRNSPRPLGECWKDASVIFINIKKHASLEDTEYTIVHEFIHHRFPGLGHHTKLTKAI